MDEREFELVNIIGSDLGANQRDLSRLMNLSLGMVNMLIRRLIAKGYIRIEQLNKRKVQYILTPIGFAEKMRKSVRYTLKTINSISLIKNRLNKVLRDSYNKGNRKFHILGHSDFALLVEMILKESRLQDCIITFIEEPPKSEMDGLLVVCREDFNEKDCPVKNRINLVSELAKDESLIQHNYEHKVFTKN